MGLWGWGRHDAQGPLLGAGAYLGQVVGQELPAEQITLPASRIEITDDRPYNEYFLLRQWGF